MERSRRELAIDMVIYRGIFKNNQITSSPVLPPKTGVSILLCTVAKPHAVSLGWVPTLYLALPLRQSLV